MGAIIGILQASPGEYLQSGIADTGAAISPEEINSLIEQRDQARADKDFTKADEIRETLEDQGVIIEDGAQGTTWRRT